MKLDCGPTDTGEAGYYIELLLNTECLRSMLRTLDKLYDSTRNSKKEGPLGLQRTPTYFKMGALSS